jgi:hypothetical protein
MPILRMRNAIDRKLQQYQEITDVYSAFIGDANGNIYPDPTNTNVIFIRYIDGELGSCFNQRVPNVPNWPVRVGFDPNMPRILQVLGTRDVGYNLSNNLPNVPPQLASLMQWPGPMTLYVRGEQIMPALVVGNNGLLLTIYPFFFPLSTGLWGYFPPKADGTPQTYDLSAHLPATGASAILVSVSDSGVIVHTHGKTETTPELISAADFPAAPDLTYHPLCAVRLYSGQTVIRQEKFYSDIFDLRWVSRWSPLNTTLIYFFQDTASDIATYKKMLAASFSPKTTLPFAGLAAGLTTLINFATDPGIPNLSTIPAGQYTVHVHVSQPSGTKSTVLYAEIWEVNAAGADIAKIVTTENTPTLSGTEIEHDISFFRATAYTLADVTSRIVTRIIANVTGGGSAPTVDLFYGGTADARVTLPTISSGGLLPIQTANRIIISDPSGNITTNGFFQVSTAGALHESPVFGDSVPGLQGSGLVHSTGDSVNDYAGRFYAWYFGVNSVPGHTGVRGRGTPASPAYIHSGDILEVLRGAGFGVTDTPAPGNVGYALPAETASSALWSRGELRCIASEDHDTVSKRGVRWELWAIPNGSITKQLIATFTTAGIDIPAGSIFSVNSVATVLTSRSISTVSPLAGGGDLSANRTLTITPATGTDPGSMSSSDFNKLAGISAGADVTAAALGAAIHGATLDGAPVGADEFPLADSAASFVLKKTTLNVITTFIENSIVLLQNFINVSGWNSDANTWTYVSADAPIFVLSVNADITDFIGVGDRIKLTQPTIKYFIVHAISFGSGATTITIYGGTDYTLINAAISAPNFSHVKHPIGFPADQDKWTVSLLDKTNAAGTATSTTISNAGSLSIVMPIGSWKTQISWNHEIAAAVTAARNMRIDSGLSTANNTFSDTTLMASNVNPMPVSSGGTVLNCRAPVFRRKIVTVAAKTTYFLNVRPILTTDAISSVSLRGDISDTSVRLIDAYL